MKIAYTLIAVALLLGASHASAATARQYVVSYAKTDISEGTSTVISVTNHAFGGTCYVETRWFLQDSSLVCTLGSTLRNRNSISHCSAATPTVDCAQTCMSGVDGEETYVQVHMTGRCKNTGQVDARLYESDGSDLEGVNRLRVHRHNNSSIFVPPPPFTF